MATGIIIMILTKAMCPSIWRWIIPAEASHFDSQILLRWVSRPGSSIAGVAQPGQRREAQDLVPQGFVGSNPTPRIT